MSFLAPYETHHNNLRLRIKPLLLNSKEQFFFKSFYLIQNVNHLFLSVEEEQCQLTMSVNYCRQTTLIFKAK